MDEETGVDRVERAPHMDNGSGLKRVEREQCMDNKTDVKPVTKKACMKYGVRFMPTNLTESLMPYNTAIKSLAMYGALDILSRVLKNSNPNLWYSNDPGRDTFSEIPEILHAQVNLTIMDWMMLMFFYFFDKYWEPTVTCVLFRSWNNVTKFCIGMNDGKKQIAIHFEYRKDIEVVDENDTESRRDFWHIHFCDFKSNPVTWNPSKKVTIEAAEKSCVCDMFQKIVGKEDQGFDTDSFLAPKDIFPEKWVKQF